VTETPTALAGIVPGGEPGVSFEERRETPLDSADLRDHDPGDPSSSQVARVAK
jgi:hypothetical protein